jgi:hypothetical protein
MQPLPLSPAAEHLREELVQAGQTHPESGPKYHVAGMGAVFYFAYEQLRNAAEYREHHLLLRAAINRYLARYVRLDHFEPAASELITELTQAGYLKNDSVSLATVTEIDRLLENYALMYRTLHATRRINRGATAQWFYAIAAVKIETLIAPDPVTPVVMQFAYDHFLEAIDRDASIGKLKPDDQHYRVAMYCAVQRALFKSDLATIRYYCVTTSLPDLMHTPIEHFIELNMLITELHQAPLTNHLFRLINRYGAPMRILREVILSSDASAVLPNRSKLLEVVRLTCGMQYQAVHDKLRSRVGKTILFVLITKTLVGVAIEVPYDLAVAGAVQWKALVANIAFPVLYLTGFSASITTPSKQNTELVTSYIDRILYDGAGAPVQYRPRRRVSKRSLNAIFNVIYALGFLLSLALLLWCLKSLGFNIVFSASACVVFHESSYSSTSARASCKHWPTSSPHRLCASGTGSPTPIRA